MMKNTLKLAFIDYICLDRVLYSTEVTALVLTHNMFTYLSRNALEAVYSTDLKQLKGDVRHNIKWCALRADS